MAHSCLRWYVPNVKRVDFRYHVLTPLPDTLPTEFREKLQSLGIYYQCSCYENAHYMCV